MSARKRFVRVMAKEANWKAVQAQKEKRFLVPSKQRDFLKKILENDRPAGSDDYRKPGSGGAGER